MDYLSLLRKGYGGGGINEEVVKELLKDRGTVHWNHKVNKAYEEIIRNHKVNNAFEEIISVTGKDDLLTMENIIADPTSGERVSPFLFIQVLLGCCNNIKHPTVNKEGTVLSDVQNAMAIPAGDIIVVPKAARKQMSFGFDAVTEILKNCCASHTVIHSILKSALMTLQEKIKEWGPQQLETPGQEMALCRILELMGKICEIAKEARESTKRKNIKSNSSCERCKTKGHGSSTIITPFINRVNARYDDYTSSAMRAINSENYNLPPEFLVKGGRKPRNPRLLRDYPGCSFTSSSNISSMTEDWATGRIKERVKRVRLDTGIRLIMNQHNKNKDDQNKERAEVTVLENSGLRPLISPMKPSPETSQEGSTGETAPLESVSLIDETGSVDGVLAPTSKQVQVHASGSLAMESRGQTPGTEWTKLKNTVTNKAIARYASKGSGINTGKHRSFNPTI